MVLCNIGRQHSATQNVVHDVLKIKMVNLIVLVLLSIQLGTSLGCSCLPGSLQRFKCKPDVHNIFRVEIKNITSEEDPTEGWSPFAYEAGEYDNRVTQSPWNNKREVSANVTKVFKGDGVEVGDYIKISSTMMGSLCGVGGSLKPGRTFYLSSGTPVPRVFSIGLCDTLYSASYRSNAEAVERILEKHDCECDIFRCKLRDGKRVFRGFCGDENAWCARDERDVCRWNDAESIQSCKRSPWDW
eukprot:sb/3468984/